MAFIFQTYFTLLVNEENGTSTVLDSEQISCLLLNGSLIDGAGLIVKENVFGILVHPSILALTE